MRRVKRNSLIAKIIAITAAVIMPGRTAGIMISHKIRKSLAPSVRAASSSSFGMSIMYERIIHVTIDRLIAEYTSINAQIVTSRPIFRNKKKIGIATIAGAIIRVDRM